MPYTPDIKELPQHVRDYLNYKRVIQNCSQKTVDEYALDLQTFFKYITLKRSGSASFDEKIIAETDISMLNIDLIGDIGTDEVYEFLMYASSERKNQTAARARKLSAIKGFYKYLTVRVHAVDKNPAIDIESPRKKQQLPKYLSVEESLALLDAVNNDEQSKTKKRDFAIITLFLNCGMRLSELCGISINDIDQNELRSLRVIGKGAKERVIYLNDACRAALIEYLKERESFIAEKKTAPTGSPLFLSSRNQRISPKTVQFIVYKYLAAAGLDYKRYSVHKLRHTAATLMYQSGEVDIRVLKDILGHEQLNTTQIYTHVSNRGMEEAMSHNPLNVKREEKK